MQTEDGFLKDLSTIHKKAGAAVFFKDIGLCLNVKISGLLSSTLIELQAIALAFECVPSFSSVCLYFDSQTALDVCKSELYLHVVDIICHKNLRIKWLKVKDYSDVVENDCVDAFAVIASLSDWFLPPCLKKHCLLANGNLKVGFGSKVLVSDLLSDIDWLSFFLVWHSDLHMAADFISKSSKCFYSRHYPSILCLFCNNVKVLDHLLSFCACNISVFTVLYKDFVFKDWFQETVFIFHNPKIASQRIVDFMYAFSLTFKNCIWLVHAKYHAFIEKNWLIPLDSSILISIFGMFSELFASIIRLLGIADAFGVCFGFCKSYSFFSGVGKDVSVHIVA
ncbi:hypothetical protein G9A89_004891 [Geosiphon pyriformis]|nr:hypothetical protein G9A89_004891 [Geosiphon pyriformis]